MQVAQVQNGTSVNRAKAGFTLIEVIAVLVILAVLAAVAIPRYVSLIEDARDAALQGALAAGLSHLSLTYGRLALQTGEEPSRDAVVGAAGGVNAPQSADFTITFANGAAANEITVTATEDGGQASPRSATAPWQMP